MKYCKSLGEWNISRRRFDRQRGEKLTRTSSTKVRVFTKLSETSEQWPEQVEVLRKVETVETTSTTRRATRGVKQNQARKIETETNLPRSATNRTTWGCEQNKARKIETVKSTQQRAERLGVEQTKARKIETETCLQWAEQLEVFSKTKQDLRLAHRLLVNKEKCNVSAPGGWFNYLTEITATVYPNT